MERDVLRFTVGVLGIAVLGACHERAGGQGVTDTALSANDTTAQASGAAAAQAGSSDSELPPGDTTVFKSGEATYTREGQRITLPFYSGKLVTHAADEMGITGSVFLYYMPHAGDGPQGGLGLTVNRQQNQNVTLGDLTLSRGSDWRISPSARCAVQMTEMDKAGIRGSVSCSDPKGPQGPITFHAQP